MCEITCGACGAKSKADLWLETVVKGRLPGGHLQCPACKVAINRKVTKSKILEINGKELFIPEKIVLERIPSYL